MWLHTAQMQAAADASNAPGWGCSITGSLAGPIGHGSTQAPVHHSIMTPARTIALTLCPYVAGSYSYVAAGSCARTYEELAKPVRRRLLFAGEHTCKVCLLDLVGRMWDGLDGNPDHVSQAAELG